MKVFYNACSFASILPGEYTCRLRASRGGNENASIEEKRIVGH